MNARLEAIAPGVYYGMAAAEYHAVESMSASGIKKMLRSPAHYKLMREEESQPSEAMRFGTAVHCGVLEPDKFAAEVCQAPDINKRTNAGKAEWAQFQADNPNRLILSADDFERCQRCIEAVRSHPAAARLLNGATFEVSMFWTDGEYDVPCKLRADFLSHGGITDLKTTTDASPEGFARSAASFYYHVQGAHYYRGTEHCMNATPEFFAMIAVESEPPYAVACYSLPRPALLAGMHLADRALALYRDALKAGAWPGYGDTIKPLELPRHALRFDI